MRRLYKEACARACGTTTALNLESRPGEAAESRGCSELIQSHFPLDECHVRSYADLIKSVQDGKPLNEMKRIAETTLTAIMGRMSAYTGKLVTWDFAMKSQLNLFPETTLAFGAWPTPAVAMPGKDPLI